MSRYRKKIKNSNRWKKRLVARLALKKRTESKTQLHRIFGLGKRFYKVITVIVFFVGMYFLKDPIVKEIRGESKYVQEENVKNYGTLKTDEEIVQNLIWKNVDSRWSGSSKSVIDLSTIRHGIEMKVWAEGSKLWVSGDVRDHFGNLIARILRNEWIINPVLSFDKNFDDNAFEVLDARGNVVFQIQLFRNEVTIKGEFYDETGYGFILQDIPNVGEVNSELVLIDGKRTPWPHFGNHIEAIFRYPSNLNFGRRVK